MSDINDKFENELYEKEFDLFNYRKNKIYVDKIMGVYQSIAVHEANKSCQGCERLCNPFGKRQVAHVP